MSCPQGEEIEKENKILFVADVICVKGLFVPPKQPVATESRFVPLMSVLKVHLTNTIRVMHIARHSKSKRLQSVILEKVKG